MITSLLSFFATIPLFETVTFLNKNFTIIQRNFHSVLCVFHIRFVTFPKISQISSNIFLPFCLDFVSTVQNISYISFRMQKHRCQHSAQRDAKQRLYQLCPINEKILPVRKAFPGEQPKKDTNRIAGRYISALSTNLFKLIINRSVNLRR